MNDSENGGSKTVITEVFSADSSRSFKLPLAEVSCRAGFPSPAEDYIEKKIDLNEHLIKHPAATFFVRVAGDSMVDAGIHDEDILIVDRALEPVNGKIVIAVIDGELSVKRLRKEDGDLYLQAENDQYDAIPVREESDFRVWGVVTHVIHSL